MKVFTLWIFISLGISGVFFPNILHAQDNIYSVSDSNKSFTKHIRISGLFYLAGQYKTQDDTKTFAFLVRRAYLTVEANISKNLSVRYTQDITIDDQGDDAGNIELRIKYLYLQYKIPNFWILTYSRLKFGIFQRPWLDFEEHINAYRVQGTMFMERSGLFNSAGFGLSYEGYFGGQLIGRYTQRVHPHNPGKYGSFSLGLFNGGGYHQFEANLSKNFEARITLRPFPVFIPGLQFSYLGIFGKGNIPENPDFILNAGIVTYESRYITVIAQYEKGNGNSYGTYVDSSYRALPHHGFSFYGEFKIPETKLAAFGRYDSFHLNEKDEKRNTRQIYGLSWRFFKQNKLVFSYQNEKLGNKSATNIYDLAIDISF